MKKGFTLVELLGVIAILAALLAISVPNILNAINNSKKSVFENDILTLSENLILQYETKSSQQQLSDFTYTFPMSDSAKESSKIKGDSPSSGEMHLEIKTEDGIKYAEVIINKVVSNDGKWCAIKGSNDKQATIYESSVANCQ